MRTFKRLLSVLLIAAMLTGMVPFRELSRIAYAAPAEGTMTNSSTVVDLDELREKVTDEIDTDNDGVVDQIEKILGTNPDNKDTDGDGLNDLFELENGLDPLKEDTNDDGLSDLYEITRGNPDVEITPELVLRDTDGDGTPDVFDDDNDGDGLKDYLDISPFSSIDADESQNIKVTTSGKATFITIQIQPADVENLYKNNQIMSWPVDNYGQVRNFDGSKGDLRIVPMLEVKMKDYPDEQIQREYGYVFTGDNLLVPLQTLEQEGSYAGMQATIYLPEKAGEQIEDDKYEVEMALKLKWSLYGAVDNINKEWDNIGAVQYNGRDITFVDFDYDYDKEYLGSDIGNLNGNEKPDMAVFWLKSYKSQVDGRIISDVFARYYYDLEYDEDDNVYQAASRSSIKTLLAFYDIPGYKNKDEDPDSSLLRTFNGKFNINLDNNELNTVNYSGDTTLTVEPTPGSGYAKKLWSIRGDIAKGNINIENHDFYHVEPKSTYGIPSFKPLAILSNIRDSYYKYDSENDTVWYLYEMYNSTADSNELILKRNYKSGNNYVTQTEVLLTGLPADATTETEYRRFRDLTRALSLDIYDVNGDEKPDMMLTDRSGQMHIITDIYSSGWQDRMIQIPLKLSTDKVLSQHTRFFDFDDNGSMDLVNVQAVRTRASNKTDLTFRIAAKESIEKSSKFLSQEYEAFKITGLQVEEKNGIETATISGEDTKRLLNMAAVFQHLYMNGDSPIDQEIEDYKENVMDNPDNIDVLKGEYDHFYAAMLDIGKQVTEDIGRRYEGPKPVIILTQEKNRYLNLDDLEDVNFTGNAINVDVSPQEMVTRKQMTVQWVEDGQALSQYDINDMVDENPNDIPDFNNDKYEVKEQLAFWNIGMSKIIGIGTEYVEAIPEYIVEDTYAWAAYPDTALSALTKLLSIKAPVQTIGNVGWAYEVKMARYNAYTRVGKGAGAIGPIANVAMAVHSGYLYGQEMAKVGGTKFGVATGVTYGLLIYASTYLYTVLAAMGPVGWVIMAALVVDTLVAFFVDDYDGVVAIVITKIMTWLYYAKQYPGTFLRTFRQTDDSDKNKQISTNTDYGFTIGSEVRTLSEFLTRVRAATKDTPANKKSKLEDSYANFYLENESTAVTVDNNREQTSENVWKGAGYWNHTRRVEFDNTLLFEKPGMSLQVDHRSALYYYLIEKVTETRYAMYKEYEYEWDSGTIRNSNSTYYDVIPNELEHFWTAFNFITTTEREPLVENNEIALLDPDGDGLFTHGDKEIDEDGNIIASDPFNYDTDGDGISDNYEIIIGTDPNNSDTDGDGLTDLEDLIQGTDPLNPDTDGDGVDDYIEVNVPVEITIMVDGGSITAQAYSSPLLEDTDGDGIPDAVERAQGSNPASKFTHGQELYDGNEFPPSLIKDFENINIIDGDTVELDLHEYIEDQDGDDLVFRASIGKVDSSGIWTYTFDPVNDGKIVEVKIEAFDLKAGELATSFIVHDTTAPFVTAVEAEAPVGIVTAETTETFNERLESNPTFTIEFNQDISIVDSVYGDSGGITIEPINREELDIDSNGVPVSVAASVYQTTPNTITVSRIEPVVENGIEYKLVIPQGAIKDTSDNFLEKDHDIRFTTVDTIKPKLVSITSAVDLDTPLIIQFNEEIDILDYEIFIEEANGDNKTTVVGDVYGNKGIKVNITSNLLDSFTTYRLYDDEVDSSVLSIKVADKNGNPFETRVEEMDAALTTFTTGEVAGPMIEAMKANVFNADVYSVDIASGEIRIPFDKPIFPGPHFEHIILSYDRSIGFWGNARNNMLRSEIKKARLSGDIRIEGNTLVITPVSPTPFDEDMSYAVFIPEKALVDGVNNYIKDDWDNSVLVHGQWVQDDNYLKINANKSLINPPEVKFVVSPRDTSTTGSVKTMIRSFTANNRIEPSKILFAVFAEDALVNGYNYLNTITIWQLNDDGSEASEVHIEDVILQSNSIGFGSYAMVISLEDVIEKGYSYKMKIPENLIKNASGVPQLANEYQEIIFSVKNEGFTLSAGGDLDKDSFLGMKRVGEKLFVESKYKKYMDMVIGSLEYQWYRGDTDQEDSLTLIPDADELVYIPTQEDEGKYLFLKLTSHYSGGSETREFMSPALGPIAPAFITGSELTSLSVKNNDSEYLENFSNDTTNYEISVPVNVNSVRVNATYDKALNSFVSINGIPSEFWEKDDGLEIPLEFGDNTIIVTSTAENYLGSKNFVIKVNRDTESMEGQEQLKPEARFVKIDNEKDFFIGKTLIGDYVFYDELDREEEGTTYQWYRQDDDEGNGRAPIPGPTGLTYTLTDSDIGKYVYFTVTPKAQGSIEGDTEESWWIGPIQQVDDKETSLTDISVKYKGQELLTAFAPQQKTYQIRLKSEEDDSTVTVAAAGDNISINGLAGNTHMIDFYEDDLVEVRDVFNGSSYFIAVSDMPFQDAVSISGGNTVEIPESGEAISMQEAIAYDQYGEVMEDVDFEWTVPSGYDYQVEGEHNQVLTIYITSTAQEGTIGIRASVKGDEIVSKVKNLSIQDEQATEDITFPTVDDATIDTGNITDTGVTLTWSKATDNVSAQSVLQYLVYKSNSSNIDNIADIEANGTPVGAYAADIDSKELTGLTGSTTYYFNVMVKDEAGNKTAYTMNSIVTAATPGGGSSGNNGGSSSAPSTSVSTTSSEDGKTSTASVIIAPSIDENTGIAYSKVEAGVMEDLIAKAKGFEAAGQKSVVEVKVEANSDTKVVEVEIPGNAFKQVSETNTTNVKIDAGIATAVFDIKAVDAISSAAAERNISISITKVEKDLLAEEVQAQVGDRPVYNFTVKAGNTMVSDFNDGYASISIPYTPKPGEKKNSIIVYYIDDTGKLKTVRGKYNDAMGTVNFKTAHFSQFAVGYNEVNFDDVANDAWYNEAVGFMAGRGIVNGVGGGRFAPADNVTRADFLIMVMNSYGIELDSDITGNFSDAGDKYYTKYLGTAKRLGLVTGVGNNLYLPSATISRQDMFVILYRILDKLGELPEGNGRKTLEDFNDVADIADYAKEAIKLFVETGTIQGDGKKLTPKATSTRAQAVQVLYNLLSK